MYFNTLHIRELPVCVRTKPLSIYLKFCIEQQLSIFSLVLLYLPHNFFQYVKVIFDFLILRREFTDFLQFCTRYYFDPMNKFSWWELSISYLQKLRSVYEICKIINEYIVDLLNYLIYLQSHI